MSLINPQLAIYAALLAVIILGATAALLAGKIHFDQWKEIAGWSAAAYATGAAGKSLTSTVKKMGKAKTKPDIAPSITKVG